jgi:hypothetical protein
MCCKWADAFGTLLEKPDLSVLADIAPVRFDDEDTSRGLQPGSCQSTIPVHEVVMPGRSLVLGDAGLRSALPATSR